MQPYQDRPGRPSVSRNARSVFIITASRYPGGVPIDGVDAEQPAMASRLERLEDLPRGVRSRASIETGAGMRSRSAEEQPIDRRAVAGPAEQRARDEPLIERELAMEDVPAGQTVGALEVERRVHGPLDDRRLEAGRVLGDGAGGRGSHPITFRVQSRAAKMVGRVLHVGGDAMLPAAGE